MNADDFGFTPDVNAGIVHAHLAGILTSTTLMANGNAFRDAVALAHQTPTLGVGIHLVLVQGLSVATGAPLPATPRHVLAALARKQIDVYAELRAQIEKVLAAGIRPTHLDSHKHTHVVPSVFRTVVHLAQEFNIPFVRLPFSHGIARRYYLRMFQGSSVQTTDYFMGYRLTGLIDETNLTAALRKLREGTTEFMCHPGFLGPQLSAARTRLKESRARELEALTSPQIRRLLSEAGVHLRPFGGADRPPSDVPPSR